MTGSEPQKKKRKGVTVRKVITSIIGTILIAALIATDVFLVMRWLGKKGLYDMADGSQPEVDAETAGDEWEEGDIRYDGHVYRYNDHMLTFLVMGIDSLEKLPDKEDVTDYTKGGQADTLFLVAANPDTKSMKLIAINRNSMVDVDFYDSSDNFLSTTTAQICLQHAYGDGLEESCERQRDTVSRMFYGLPINGYISMNMAAVPILNDSVGGVKLTVLENVPWGTDVIANGAGNEVTLEGMDAYYYLQYRDVNQFDSATQRLKRQKQYLSAFLSQTRAKTAENISFPLSLLNDIKDYTVTDIGTSQITYLATELLGYSVDLNNIESVQGTMAVGADEHEEYTVDQEALKKLVIETFYTRVDN